MTQWDDFGIKRDKHVGPEIFKRLLKKRALSEQQKQRRMFEKLDFVENRLGPEICTRPTILGSKPGATEGFSFWFQLSLIFSWTQ